MEVTENKVVTHDPKKTVPDIIVKAKHEIAEALGCGIDDINVTVTFKV